VHLRLTRGLLASERPAAAHASGLQDRGLQLIAHQIARAFDPSASAEVISRIEVLLLTAVSAVYGYTLGKHALLGALGREVTSELDEQFIDTLARMVHVTLRTELGRHADE
jgi:hypothetical protein